ncbi:MAG: hypothetical protein OXN18_00815 [Gemmatimonadota bacterium]|nr:hypothetical protein [Gemmatimonadota bacterium]
MNGSSREEAPRAAGGIALGPSAALIAIAATLAPPLEAQLPRASQQRVAEPGETQFNLDFLRPSGGPVIPIFEGWYRNPDGSYELSFGYFNVNTEEVLDIPQGQDNFIEPAMYDGVQPTHFLPVPDGDRRHWGVFTVTVPADFGNQDVVWNLRHEGRTYSVPGRLRSPHYQINGWTFPGKASSSPVLRLEADGAAGQGPAGITSGPVHATAGRPVRVTVRVGRDGVFPDDRRPVNLKWFRHRGPGPVGFSEREAEVPADAWSVEGGAAVSIDATFNEPGSYVIRVLAYNTIREFEFQCCWTNGYLHVEVGR